MHSQRAVQNLQIVCRRMGALDICVADDNLWFVVVVIGVIGLNFLLTIVLLLRKGGGGGGGGGGGSAKNDREAGGQPAPAAMPVNAPISACAVRCPVLTWPTATLGCSRHGPRKSRKL
eukprot:1628591-Rhodomonas_salina.2